jgi:hypothetical protein
VEQAEACLILTFANAAKFKSKQAEACSTGSGGNEKGRVCEIILRTD